VQPLTQKCQGFFIVRERKEEMLRKVLAAAGVMVLLTSRLWAEESQLTLDKIVVTPSRYSQEISEAASSISVISQNDINNSSATNSVDILRSVPGIVVRDLFGNGAKASVDLRGFGDMDSMNTLVLIDGRRINEVDLSGVDWSQIPLDQIQKIEVIRGGNSVLYGENAIGGVINIITKKGKGKPRLEIGTEFGSYDKNLEKINFSGSQDKLSYLFSASREGTNGYRNNTFFKTYDYGSKLEYDFTDELSAHFNSGFHRATYGLPGGLSEADISNFGRRFAKNGDDRATDKDYYFVAGAKNEITGLGQLCLDLSYRIKDVNSNLIGGNGGWNPIRISNIETLGLTPKFTINKPIFGQENNLTTGIDFYRSLYSADNLDSSNGLSNITRIHKYSLGGYAQEEFFILKNFSVLGGFRYESVKYSFNFHDFVYLSDIDSRIKPNEKAYNFGLNYKYGDDSNLFLNINQSYRFPATDEFFNGFSLDTSLKPELSKDFEAGVRHNFGKRLHLEVSGYRMKVKDELFTDPTLSWGLGATSNYDKTIHQGVDTNANFKVFDNLNLYGSYSYQDAEFYKSHLGGKTIPWVPNHKASLGLRFTFFNYFTMNVGGNYGGSRYRINDVHNALPKVKSYFTTDLGLSYNHKDFTISANINNLFNEYYYEFATYSAFSGNKLYYPAVGRNFGLKLDCKF
jgi:iron complex outermembrane receptor protein